MADVTTVVLVGVGGQGTILAGDVIAKVAVADRSFRRVRILADYRSRRG